MSEVIKFDKARKQIVFKERPGHWSTNDKYLTVKAKELDYFISSKNFDKDLSGYIKIGGLVYVYENPPQEKERDEEMIIKSKITVDEDLKARYFAGLDEKRQIEIQEVKEEYGL